MHVRAAFSEHQDINIEGLSLFVHGGGTGGGREGVLDLAGRFFVSY